MGLQIVESSGVQGMEVFQKILETLPGGFSFDETNNNYEVDHTIQKGHLVQYDESTRKVLIDKLGMVETASSTTVIQIEKGSGFVAGDIVSTGATGGAAYTIQSVVRTNAAYDVITLNTAIGSVSPGDIIWLSSAEGASAGAYAVTPNGVLKNDMKYKTGGNESVAVVVRGTVYERRLPGIPGGGVIAAKKTALTDRIIFSQSY